MLQVLHAEALMHMVIALLRRKCIMGWMQASIVQLADVDMSVSLISCHSWSWSQTQNLMIITCRTTAVCIDWHVCSMLCKKQTRQVGTLTSGLHCCRLLQCEMAVSAVALSLLGIILDACLQAEGSTMQGLCGSH